MIHGLSLRSLIGVSVVALLSGCGNLKFAAVNAPALFRDCDRRLDIPYGQEPRQKLDIYIPKGAADRPVVIFWYGGSWQEGRKSDYRFVGTQLAKMGFVAVLPDYRLYPQVVFPSFEQDGAQAIGWVEQQIKQFGGSPKKIVLMGHSAGAHTAAYLALNHAFLKRWGANPSAIVGLIGLSGPYEFAPNSAALRAAFASPFTEKDWQPIQFVDHESPPVLLLQGLSDTIVRPQESIDLRDALVREEIPVKLALYPHRGHVDTVASLSILLHWRLPAVEEIAAFVRQVSENSIR